MVKATCSRCGATVDWRPTRPHHGETTFGPDFFRTCEVIAERLKQDGRTSNDDCPHIDEAVGRAMDEYRRRR